jgi:flagellar basal-body rod modification protein FlgD
MSSNAISGSSSDNSSLLAAINAQNSASSASTSTDASTSLNQTFLKLLVAQLNNQDPSNPMDSTQMTSQLAQISTVSGISTLNSTVQSLVTQFQQLETMQASQLAGKQVLVAGDALTLPSGGSVTGGVNLGATASAVTVQVADSGGNVVSTMNLGPEAPGMSTFTWNGTTDAGGTAPAGNYTFSVNASNSGGQAVTATAYAPQTVTGASTASTGGIELSLGNGTQVPYSSVGQFL